MCDWPVERIRSERPKEHQQHQRVHQRDRKMDSYNTIPISHLHLYVFRIYVSNSVDCKYIYMYSVSNTKSSVHKKGLDENPVVRWFPLGIVGLWLWPTFQAATATALALYLVCLSFLDFQSVLWHWQRFLVFIYRCRFVSDAICVQLELNVRLCDVGLLFDAQTKRKREACGAHRFIAKWLYGTVCGKCQHHQQSRKPQNGTHSFNAPCFI